MLHCCIFLCGAALMIIELTGSRILAPFLGTSLVVWTCLIGIILASLSLGAWWGGSLADRFPQTRLLGRIVLLSAWATAAIGLSKTWVLEFLQGAGSMHTRCHRRHRGPVCTGGGSARHGAPFCRTPLPGRSRPWRTDSGQPLCDFHHRLHRGHLSCRLCPHRLGGQHRHSVHHRCLPGRCLLAGRLRRQTAEGRIHPPFRPGGFLLPPARPLACAARLSRPGHSL